MQTPTPSALHLRSLAAVPAARTATAADALAAAALAGAAPVFGDIVTVTLRSGAVLSSSDGTLPDHTSCMLKVSSSCELHLLLRELSSLGVLIGMLRSDTVHSEMLIRTLNEHAGVAQLFTRPWVQAEVRSENGVSEEVSQDLIRGLTQSFSRVRGVLPAPQFLSPTQLTRMRAFEQACSF